ncbi:MAG: glycosyltransferase family 2 protein, partial [Planctomycetota bacterium]|nr:glycosyltransferase family 2 protein [Planctomycetota bacterium]
VNSVLDQVMSYSEKVLVVDDGSTDGTAGLLAKREGILIETHSANRGYGAALITAFRYAIEHEYDILVTIDCDGQHEPQRIPEFVNACQSKGVEIVSGSRYLKQFEGDSQPPEQRMKINHKITGLMNERLGLELTDAFCGFKAYQVAALARMDLKESGYAMPLELWVQAVCHGLKVIELPVPLIYLDEKRSFGGGLDDGQQRLQYYLEVINRSLKALPQDNRYYSETELIPCD